MWKWTFRDILKFLAISLFPVLLYELLGWKWLHLPWLPIALIGTAVAFVISFKNNASYDRLWEARKIWGGIVNASRSWAIMVRDLINNQYAENNVSDDELISIHKELIMRHVAWMMAHRYTLRSDRPWEHFFKRKSNQKYKNYYKVPEHHEDLEKAISQYLSEKELLELKHSSNKASKLLSDQSARLKELKERGLIWEFSHLELEKMLVEFYALQGKNERIKNFPYPRQFATLNLFFVWIFIVLLPFGVMSAFEDIGQDIKERVEVNTFMDWITYYIADHFIWLSIPFSVVISWVFHTMERIGESSENPFEGTAMDVPITTMSRGIEIDMLEIIGVPKDEIPAPIEMTNHVQM